ncbi:MAG: Transglutaminase protein, partial [Hyphomicrobiales bacterium]|nr:Transglutaminase protein [Hyphomicrobiales bacterium]
MRFSLGCELAYDVLEPSTLILNIEVMRSKTLQIHSETIDVTPFAQAEPHVATETGNLYRRLVLSPGAYSV